jgi:hypothetical protein
MESKQLWAWDEVMAYSMLSNSAAETTAGDMRLWSRGGNSRGIDAMVSSDS